MTIIIDPANPKIKISSLNKGLVGHWPLDQESFNPATKRFTDKSAYSNHGTGNGTQLGSATLGFQADRMGQLVRACPFNGTDDYIDCGNDASLAITNEITISMWIHRDTDSGTYERLLFKNGVSDYYIQISDTDKFIFRIGGLDAVSSLIDIKIGEWVLATAKYDGSFSKIFLDGVLDNSVSNAGAIPTSAGNLLIGKFGSYKFNGLLADVRIYNRAISLQEITLLYEQYRPKLGIG